MPITTPFSFETTAAEVVDGIDLGGKNAIVTGGASGIGIETARALAGAGATVTIAVRNLEAGEQTAAAIDGDVRVRYLDLAERESIAAFVAGWDDPLHILVDNAGVMALPERRLSRDGWELQFATNHLGHFELALGLHDALKAGAPARVVSLSSSAHLQSPVLFDDINFDFIPYTPFMAYGQSKTANVLFAVGADERWADAGIRVNAVMPGAIATNLQRHVDWDELVRARAEMPGWRAKTPEQGAATSVLVAASPLLEGVGGRYFDDCNEAAVVSHRGEAGVLNGVAPYALDKANADRLWELSLEAVARPARVSAATA
jgi:NAD(P)-dependent dehydrogenase (short-subunit alcohol dehydrogenase family)